MVQVSCYPQPLPRPAVSMMRFLSPQDFTNVNETDEDLIEFLTILETVIFIGSLDTMIVCN